jgi:molybdenum cofactor cytidylyltransferase
MRAPSIAGVILAAGESSRMGRDKALLPWHGKTFLQAHIEVLYPHTELVIVVAGKNHGALAPVVYATSAFLTENPRPELGQFSSLQVGLREVLNRGRDAAIIGLVDRPPCKSETVVFLRERFLAVYSAGRWAAVPEFGGKHGHPIVAGREMIEAFLKTPATSTARDAEHAAQMQIEYIPVSDPAVVMNVDTPEDYERLQIQVPQP